MKLDVMRAENDCANPNHKIPSPKQCQMTKKPNSKLHYVRKGDWMLVIWDLEFGSGFAGLGEW